MKISLKYTMNGLDKKGAVISLSGTEKINYDLRCGIIVL